MCWPRERPATHAAAGAAARGVRGGLGDSFTCSELGNDTDDTEGRGAVAVCFEGCCESMCWPVDRPATHAAAGAAARGVRGIGGFFYTSGSGGTGGVIHCRRAAAGATRRGFLRRFVCRGGFSDEFQGAGEIAAPPAVALVEAVDLIGEGAQRSGGLGLAG